MNINNRTYMTIKLNRQLKQREKVLLNTRIKQDLYHIEIDEKEDKTIINVYNENPKLNLVMKKSM